MRFLGRFGFAVAAVFLVTSCSNSESSERTRNSELTKSYTLGYSCAQLKTESVTAETTEIRFTLCDNAEMYSIVTPPGVDGAVENQAVTNNREVIVPVKPEVNGEATKLIVKTIGSDFDDDSSYHSGIHIYDVSLADVSTAEVGPDNELVGSVHPRVVYDMPTPNKWIEYRRLIAESGGSDVYVGFVDNYVQKWAMVRLTTCHPSVAQARMSNAVYSTSALAQAMMNAKLIRDRDLYVSLNALRYHTAEVSETLNLCQPGESSFNVFTDGISSGYSPIQNDDIAAATNILEVAKSQMLLWYWVQVKKNECVSTNTNIPDVKAAKLQSWFTALDEKLRVLVDAPNLTTQQRESARRLLRQVDTLALLRTMRESFDGVSTCTVSAAGYDVAVVKPVDTTPPTSPTSEPSASGESEKTLSEAVESQTPESSIPTSQLNWSAASKAPLTLQVGRSLSRAQLRVLAQLKSTSTSTTTIARVGTSKKVCSVKAWGIRGVRAGTCRVRITVKATGKKAQSKVLTLTVTK